MKRLFKQLAFFLFFILCGMQNIANSTIETHYVVITIVGKPASVNSITMTYSCSSDIDAEALGLGEGPTEIELPIYKNYSTYVAISPAFPNRTQYSIDTPDVPGYRVNISGPRFEIIDGASLNVTISFEIIQ